MRKYSLLLIPFLYCGCEQTFDNSIDVTQNDYQVVSIAGIKDTVDLKIPGDSLLNVRVIFASGSQLNSVYFDIYSSENQKLNSSGVQLVAISNNIYQNSFELRREYPIGIYTVRIFVVGTDGKTNQAAVNNFYFLNGQDNVPPNIFNLNAPDTVTIGIDTVYIPVTLEVADSNGLSDVLLVWFDSFLPNGNPSSQNPIAMFDDGTNGDLIANDGIYTRIVILPPEGVTRGRYRWEFRARDRIGDLSNQIIHFLEVI